MKKYIIICLFQLFYGVSQAQLIGNSIEILGKDSLKFYLKSGMLIEKECAEIYRVAKMHPKYFVYDGYVKDYYITGEIALEGYLRANFFHGKYKSYYKNGKLKEEGVFEDGYKVGEWKYWYENGQLKKVFEFKKNEIFIKEFYTSKGKKTVVDGNGKMEEFEKETNITIDGHVKNGRMDRKWTLFSHTTKHTIAIETYSNGAFIEGYNYPYFNEPKKYVINESIIQLDSKINIVMAEIPNHIRECIQDEFRSSSIRQNSKQLNYILENYNHINSLTGYLMVGFYIDEFGKIGGIHHYSTINNDEVEKQIINLVRTSSCWKPYLYNDKPRKTYELFAFQFFGKKFKILNNALSRPTIEKGAKYLYGLDSLEKEVFKNLDVPAYFWGKGFKIAITLDFVVFKNGSVYAYDKNFAEANFSKQEEQFYLAIRRQIESLKHWQPAKTNNYPMEHNFKGVFILENGIGKMKLFSSNWVLDE